MLDTTNETQIKSDAQPQPPIIPVAVAVDTAGAAPLTAGIRLVEEDPQYWRNGVWLDMAEIIDGLRDRGFSIEGYDPSSWVQRDTPVECRLITQPAISLEIRVSQIYAEPLTLWIYRFASEETIIRRHTTTGSGLLRTVDAFLAGLRLRDV